MHTPRCRCILLDTELPHPSIARASGSARSCTHVCTHAARYRADILVYTLLRPSSLYARSPCCRTCTLSRSGRRSDLRSSLGGSYRARLGRLPWPAAARRQHPLCTERGRRCRRNCRGSSDRAHSLLDRCLGRDRTGRARPSLQPWQHGRRLFGFGCRCCRTCERPLGSHRGTLPTRRCWPSEGASSQAHSCYPSFGYISQAGYSRHLLL